MGQHVDPAGWRWAAFEVLLLVSRQNGKGTDIEILELYCLFSLDLNVYHTAHLMKTSRKAFKRLWSLISRTPQLLRRVKGKPRQTAEEIVIELTSGALITFMARSGRAGRGLDDCDVLILDEALFLEPKMVEATIPTMSTRPTPLVVYASSAGVEGSVLLRALRKRMEDGDPTIAGFDWSVDPAEVKREGFDPVAVGPVAQANPSLGGLITMDYVRGEFAAMTSTGSLAGYLRERLGVFDADPDELKRVIPAAAWADRAGADGRPEGPMAFGIAAAWPDAEKVAIGLGGRLDGELLLQVVDYRPGTEWVVERVRELVDKWGDIPVVIDPGGPAGFLIEDFENEKLEPGQKRIKVLQPTMRQIGHAAKDLRAEICGDAPTARHFNQKVLNDAVAGAGRRPLGDSWTYQRRGEVDISPLESVMLGAWGSTKVAPPPPPPVTIPSENAARNDQDVALIGF